MKPNDVRAYWGADIEWSRWFAIYPVMVDAYTNQELSDNGNKFRFRKFLCWLERRHVIRDDEDGEHQDYWEYRLPQPPESTR